MSYRAQKLQAQNWVKSDFEVKSDLEGQGRSPHKTKLFCTSDPNLVILAWMGQELSHGQAQWGMDRHRQTDAGNNNTRRPKLASGNKKSSGIEYWKYSIYSKLELIHGASTNRQVMWHKVTLVNPREDVMQLSTLWGLNKRQHFKLHFLTREVWYFDWNFWGSNWQ